ncbi:MAG: B12-binding domain-containing radical SAM protein [Deltaproteobacteria bacterium]|nr:B12-binding domain-containing radical SAM protein [Deltaproteobacteria bacterium]
MADRKKLLLILPRNERGYWGKVSKSGKAGFVRLSLPQLAALTPEDWDVEILDSRITPVDFKKKADLVGITAFTAEIPSAYAIADGFRKNGVKVVMGGVHVSALPEEALRHADSVVAGEAEAVWRDVLDDFSKDALKPVYRAGRLIEMKGMPVPRRDLLDRKLYVSGFNTLQATRGCPFGCEFCAVTAFFGEKFRTRPVGEVIDEIQGFDTRDFFFLDDNIAGKPPYAKELFKALIPLKRTWGGQTSITIAKDDELLGLYAKSGGKYAFIGFESLSEATLKRMNKSWNSPDGYRESIRKIHSAGINIIGSFVFGFDEDDPSVFKNTFDFIMENNVDAAQFNILTPFPGTKLYDALEKEGRITDRDWAKYNTGEVVFRPVCMGPEELLRGYHWIFRNTYSIKNILKRSLRSPSGIAYRIVVNLSWRKKAHRMPRVGALNFSGAGRKAAGV